MNPLAVYIHFPYCLYKCHYCDFNSYPVDFSDDLEEAYVKALLKEIQCSFQNLPSSQITSVFFGGGTPSLFSPEAFRKTLGQISQWASLHSSCEITIEMNPKTITKEKIQGYLKVGVNRFSMGVQSFEDRYLSPLGRLHTGEEAKGALALLRECEVKNFNLDLMFGFPGQTRPEVLQDIEAALRFDPPHLSFYNLTLEEGTLLNEKARRGEIHLPENEIQAGMYEDGVTSLQGRGYSAYEISNFSKEGYESRHNLAYWRYEEYLGLGAGAVGFLRKERARGEGLGVRGKEEVYGYRWTNPKTPKEYMSDWSNKSDKSDLETIDFKTAAGEFWMMGLRLKEGVSLEKFEERFGVERRAYYQKNVVPDLVDKKWLSQKDHHLTLTPSGRMFANEVVSKFLLD